MTTHDNTQHRDAKHSPTPWEVRENYGELRNLVFSSDGQEVAACWPQNNPEPNAACIVEAVNAHERLRDLVRRMVRPVETTLKFAIKDGEMVKHICATDEAAKKVDECIAALQDLLAEARAAIGEEAANV